MMMIPHRKKKVEVKEYKEKLIPLDEVAELYYKTVTKRNIYSDNPYKVLSQYGIKNLVWGDTTFEKFVDMFKAGNWRIV